MFLIKTVKVGKFNNGLYFRRDTLKREKYHQCSYKTKQIYEIKNGRQFNPL